MRRAVIAAVAIGILGASCASMVDPKATIAVGGTVGRQGSAPVVGAGALFLFSRFPTTGAGTRAPSVSVPARRHGLGWFVVIAGVIIGGVAGAAAMLVARDRKRGAF